jgi:predicted HTH domain antitoxin
MQITVQLPDDLAQRPGGERAALEAFVIEGYRSGVLSGAQAGGLLGLSRLGFEGFLKERQVFEHAYDVNDLERDWTNAQKDVQRRLGQYTEWLQNCPEAAGLAIAPTSDNGPFPYQWKVCTADYSRFVCYVTFDGPEVGGSETEKKRSLCMRLHEALKRAGEVT